MLSYLIRLAVITKKLVAKSANCANDVDPCLVTPRNAVNEPYILHDLFGSDQMPGPNPSELNAG
jgi:hypothetical protein